MTGEANGTERRVGPRAGHFLGIRARRDALRRHPRVRFVDRDEYCRLSISSLPLERWADTAARVRGVVHRETGARYLIEEELLSG